MTKSKIMKENTSISRVSSTRNAVEAAIDAAKASKETPWVEHGTNDGYGVSRWEERAQPKRNDQ